MRYTEPTSSTSKSITDSLEEFLQSSSNEETHALPKDVVQMIENYHQEKRLDTISWWKVKQNVYPRLSKLARKYLACPPTSVPSERVFSNAGLIYDEKRNRLSAGKAEKLMFLKHNIPKFEFQY